MGLNFLVIMSPKTKTKNLVPYWPHEHSDQFLIQPRVSIPISEMMRSPSNQKLSTRNRGNYPSAFNRRQRIQYNANTKYPNSQRNTDDGVLFLSKRRRALPTNEEVKATKKAKEITNQNKESCRYSNTSLCHKIMSTYEHGMHLSDFQFGPHNFQKVIQYL